MNKHPKTPAAAPQNTVQGARPLGRISGRPAIFFYSRKAGGTLALESAGERIIAQLAELDPRVKTISAQPFSLDINTGKVFKTRRELEAARRGRKVVDALRRDYTPDLLLVLHDHTRIVVEAKDSRHLLTDPLDQAKHERAKRILAMRGDRLLLIPLQYDESTPLIHNAELLSRSLFQSVDPSVISQLSERIEAVLGDAAMRLGDLVRELGLTLRDAPQLITHGAISADLSRIVLNADAPVCSARGSLSHLELLNLGEEKS